MKQKQKFCCAIALIAVIGCSIIACDNLDPINMEMVQISAGTFTMGSQSGNSDQRPQRQVTLSAFRIGRYEVTQRQYRAVMGTNPSYFKKAVAGENAARLPVEQVSWYDAIIFCNRLSIMEELSPAYSINGSTNPDDWGAVPVAWNDPLCAVWDTVLIVSGSTGYRLPTEAQWEYAACAGTSTAYSYGDTANGDYMWFGSNSGGITREVGKKLPNPWGLYDMHGNVWEWCWDWYGTYPSRAETNPSGAVSGSNRVVRGGGWYDSTTLTRSAYRGSSFDRDGRYGDLGFRVVRP